MCLWHQHSSDWGSMPDDLCSGGISSDWWKHCSVWRKVHLEESIQHQLSIAKPTGGNQPPPHPTTTPSQRVSTQHVVCWLLLSSTPICNLRIFFFCGAADGSSPRATIEMWPEIQRTESGLVCVHEGRWCRGRIVSRAMRGSRKWWMMIKSKDKVMDNPVWQGRLWKFRITGRLIKINAILSN